MPAPWPPQAPRHRWPGRVEFRWPDSHDQDAPDDDEVLGLLLDKRDLREQTRDLAMTAPVAELREAFKLAAQLPAWADGLAALSSRRSRPGNSAMPPRIGCRARSG